MDNQIFLSWSSAGHLRFCAQQLVSILWRLDLIFAILATLSNFYLSEQFLSKI